MPHFKGIRWYNYRQYNITCMATPMPMCTSGNWGCSQNAYTVTYYYIIVILAVLNVSTVYASVTAHIEV